MAGIPFLEMKAGYRAIAPEVQQAVNRVLERGWYILGPEVEAFEAEFATYIGVRHAIGVASGTDALVLALRACGVGPADEVITVAHTAVATVAAVELAGARPVLVDIDPRTCTMDAEAARKAITPRTRAILPVHLYGQAADLAALLEAGREAGVPIIEDACQAHGADYQGRKAGSWGDLGCFSFYPTKNLGAYGDGGMVVTDNADLARRVRLLRTYGWEGRDNSVLRGQNSRLDELQAAILRVKLARLDQDNVRRRALAAIYDAELTGIPQLTLPAEAPGRYHVYHLYAVQSPVREAARRHLADAGIGTLIHYPTPVHLQPAYRDLGYAPGSLPASERVAAEVFSLPLYPELPADQVRAVAQELKRFFSHGPGGA